MKGLQRAVVLSSVLALAAVMLAGGPAAGPGAAEPTASYVVRAADVDAAAAAVESAGGEITHRLTIIGAVGARLTAPQRAEVATRPGFFVSPDRTVEVAAADVFTVRDEFNARTFSGNDGSRSWRGDWIEFGETNGAGTGEIEVETKSENPGFCTASNCLIVEADDKTGVGVMREADLSGATSAVLSFDYGNDGAGGRVVLEVSADGGASWTHLHTFSFSSSVSHQSLSFDLTPHASSRTRIRFRVTSVDEGEMGVDDVQIAYTAAPAAATGDTTARDEFKARTFTGSDGSRGWSGDWWEIGESNGPTTGEIEVEPVTDNPTFCRASNCLIVEADNKTGVGVAREVDLSAATKATLSFVYGNDSRGGAVALEASPDGGVTWARLHTFSFATATILRPMSFDLTPYAGRRTQIRFIVTSVSEGEMGVDDVTISATASDLWTVRDEFNLALFSNSDGTLPWAGSWTEIGEGDGPLSGYVRVMTHLDDTQQALRVRNANRGARRAVDLSFAANATLSFKYRRKYLDDADDYVAVQISGDGGVTWTELGRFAGPATDDVEHTVSYDVASYASAATVVRFLGSPALASDEKVYFDNVQFSGTHAAGSGAAGGSTTAPVYSDFPSLVGADRLHAEGTAGAGVTVAVLDTGLWSWPSLTRDTGGQSRPAVRYDAIRNQPVDAGDGVDANGHGSHVASVALDSATAPSSPGLFNGIAPDAGFVAVKAFDDQGRGSYLNIIRGLDWILANKDAYHIRVVNLSFSAQARGHYWDDPLNLAIMALWRAGVVVVVSAGNNGPEPMTIGVPGNVPYVITVGAMSDAATPRIPGDDYLASFSSTGPTLEGFVKPDLVAPGGHMLGVVPPTSRLAKQHPEWLLDSTHLYMSGTSQAAAVVTGTVALLLQSEPGLTPDDVKCRLMASAAPAVDGGGHLAYSVFQQGAGKVDAYAAVHGTASGCANRGLDVAADLTGKQHFGGRGDRRADGTFFVRDQADVGAGFTWDGAYSWSGAYLWSDAYPWVDAYLWSDAYPWVDAYLWSDAYPWVDAYLWSDGLTETTSINAWVPQE